MEKPKIRSVVKALIPPLIAMVLTVCFVMAWYSCYWYPDNKACHEKCKQAGYAAGEDEMLYEHTVCACFSSKPGPRVHFVLEKSDKLED